jgi:hypothetical protein
MNQKRRGDGAVYARILLVQAFFIWRYDQNRSKTTTNKKTRRVALTKRRVSGLALLPRRAAR